MPYLLTINLTSSMFCKSLVDLKVDEEHNYDWNVE